MSGLFDVIDDPPIRYGFIVICSDSVEKNSLVGFLLIRVVVNNMAVAFRTAVELVGMIVC